MDASEVEVIRRMADWLGISPKDLKSIEATFYTDVASHYAVLEVSESASDAEVKKAYRRMAIKFHPDKVGDMGADYQKQARLRIELRDVDERVLQLADEVLVAEKEAHAALQAFSAERAPPTTGAQWGPLRWRGLEQAAWGQP